MKKNVSLICKGLFYFTIIMLIIIVVPLVLYFLYVYCFNYIDDFFGKDALLGYLGTSITIFIAMLTLYYENKRAKDEEEKRKENEILEYLKRIRPNFVVDLCFQEKVSFKIHNITDNPACNLYLNATKIIAYIPGGGSSEQILISEKEVIYKNKKFDLFECFDVDEDGIPLSFTLNATDKEGNILLFAYELDCDDQYSYRCVDLYYL